jgi:hypothetical protein
VPVVLPPASTIAPSLKAKSSVGNVASDIHQEVWGAMEKFAAPGYTVLQFDVI